MTLFDNYFFDAKPDYIAKYNIDRIESAITQKDFQQSLLGQIIHVAGTNGKGSTCSFLQQMLTAKGFKVAMFTSPHIFRSNERVSINGEPICDEDFDKLFQNNYELIREYQLSYFESAQLIAFDYFCQQMPDYTILETGLGGRIDSTNLSVIKKKISVLTRIALDHQRVLGNSIEEITAEKAAIARNGQPLLVGLNSKVVTDKIESLINDKLIETPSSTTYLSEKDLITSRSPFPPPFDENYALAKKLVDNLLDLPVSKQNTTHERDTFYKLPVGRLMEGKRFLIDSAHNANAITLLTENITKNNITNANITNANIYVAVITATKGRDPAEYIKILSNRIKLIIVTEAPGFPVDFDKNDSRFISDPLEAINKAIELAALEQNCKIMVTGSIYLVAYLLEHCENIKEDLYLPSYNMVTEKKLNDITDIDDLQQLANKQNKDFNNGESSAV